MKLQKQIEEMKRLRAEGKSIREVGEILKINPSSVQYYTSEGYMERAKERAKSYYEKLSPEKKKIKSERQKDYQKDYQKKRYKTDEGFRKRVIQSVINYKKRKSDAINIRNRQVEV